MHFYPHDTRTAKFFFTSLFVWPAIAVVFIVLLHFTFLLDLESDLLLVLISLMRESLIGFGYLGMGRCGVEVQESDILIKRAFFKVNVSYQDISCVCISEWFPCKVPGDNDYRIYILSKKFDKMKLEQNAVEEYVGRGRNADGAQIVSASYSEIFIREFFSHCRCPLYLSPEVYKDHGDEILRHLNHNDTYKYMQARQTSKNYRIQ